MALVQKINPDIVTDPTVVESGGTCKQQCIQVAGDRAKEIAAAKIAPGTKHGDLEELMMETKVTIMKQNIEILETDTMCMEKSQCQDSRV